MTAAEDNQKKYELTDNYIELDGRVLFRIRALQSFWNKTHYIAAGDLGGYIEDQRCLSQDSNCWVFDNSKVYASSRVQDQAIVRGNSLVWDHCHLSGNVVVDNNSRISGYIDLLDYSTVSNSQIYNNATISSSYISGKSFILGVEQITGVKINNSNIIAPEGDAIYLDGARCRLIRIEDAEIHKQQDIFWVDHIGSRDDTTTFHKVKGGGISVATGCFHGDIGKFQNAIHAEYNKVNPTDEETYYFNCYMAAIVLVKRMMRYQNN